MWKLIKSSRQTVSAGPELHWWLIDIVAGWLRKVRSLQDCSWITLIFLLNRLVSVTLSPVLKKHPCYMCRTMRSCRCVKYFCMATAPLWCLRIVFCRARVCRGNGAIWAGLAISHWERFYLQTRKSSVRRWHIKNYRRNMFYIKRQQMTWKLSLRIYGRADQCSVWIALVLWWLRCFYQTLFNLFLSRLSTSADI